jgi:hypothetical protein
MTRETMPTTKETTMTWTIDIGPGGHVRPPRLPDVATVPGLAAPTRKLWARFDALARQHADLAAERARVEAVAIPEAEVAQREHAVEAVRAGRPVEFGPDPAALRERAQRLQVEADAVVVVMGEVFGELGDALVAEQPKLLGQALAAFNGIDAGDWRGRCEAALAVGWAAGLQVDGDMPMQGPASDCEGHASALIDVPVAYVATVLEPVAGLLAAKDTAA